MSRAAGSDPSLLRTFVAIHVPSMIQTAAAGLIEQCGETLEPGAVRWVRPEDLHLTLRFLGNIPPSAQDALQESLGKAATEVSPFRVCAAPAGCFPNLNSPRVVWLGVAGDRHRLAALQEAVVRLTYEWGQPEDRPFHPHLTLGRVTARGHRELSRIGDWVRGAPCTPQDPWRVDCIHLMRSLPTSVGPRYSTLASFPLNR
jgi:2'-5' RNA ligase